MGQSRFPQKSYITSTPSHDVVSFCQFQLKSSFLIRGQPSTMEPSILSYPRPLVFDEDFFVPAARESCQRLFAEQDPATYCICKFASSEERLKVDKYNSFGDHSLANSVNRYFGLNLDLTILILFSLTFLRLRPQTPTKTTQTNLKVCSAFGRKLKWTA